jgi:alkylation response protein AidB-like acyl-CoA dehydrogenase
MSSPSACSVSPAEKGLLMFFALTDEQRALATTVRDFLADRFGPARVRAVYDDLEGDGHPADLWKSCAEQGWLAIMIPAEFDGLGLGLLDASVVARAFGVATTPGPWLPTLLGAEAIRLAGSEEQKLNWLTRVAAGHAVLTLASRGRGGGYDTAGAATIADGERLTGSAVQVEYAHVADALVTASTDGRLWLVDAGAEGLGIERTDALDRTTRLATVQFDGVHATELPDAGPRTLDTIYRAGAVLVGHDLVGIARSALTRTVAYDKEREQFGRPVGSFQAIKHALADLHVGITMAEHGTLYAAYAVDAALPDADIAVSVAKSKASDVARDATAAMIQYLGGIGYTWEHDAHFAFKRAKREEYLYGDGSWHRERLAGALIEQVTRQE